MGIEIRTCSFEHAEELVDLRCIALLDKHVVPECLIQFFFADKSGFGMIISVCGKHMKIISNDER